MAQNPKRLRVVGARTLGARTRALAVECVEGGAFDGVGGRYVIVHTGAFAGERAIKRAYSLVPCAEGGAAVFELIVERREDGPGSMALHEVPVGTELAFSGPWGKLVPESGLPPRTLFVATDTGITSALGLVEQHRVEGAEVLWLRPAQGVIPRPKAEEPPGARTWGVLSFVATAPQDRLCFAPQDDTGARALSDEAERVPGDGDDDFLPVDLVRVRVEAAGARFVTAAIPPASDPARPRAAWTLVDGRVAERAPSLVIATGDGRVVHPLPARLHGVETRIECYFHNPEKKSAS